MDSRRLLERDLDLDLEWLGAYKDSFMVSLTVVPKKYEHSKTCNSFLIQKYDLLNMYFEPTLRTSQSYQIVKQIYV